MAKEFLHKHFINEAKAAINRWSGVGGSGGTTPAPGGIVEIDVLPEMEMSFVNSYDPVWSEYIEKLFSLIPGKTYTVVIDGVSYTSVAREATWNDESYYGVELGWTWDDDDNIVYNGTPFYIEVYSDKDDYEDGNHYFYVGLPQVPGDVEVFTRKIRIYQQCDISDTSTVVTNVTIPTQNHYDGYIRHDIPFRFIAGGTYSVKFADKVYECKCGIDDEYGMPYIGNPSLAALTPNPEDLQYPFFVTRGYDDDTGLEFLMVMIDTETFPIGEDIHVSCSFDVAHDIKLEYRTITDPGVHYPVDAADGFAGVNVDVKPIIVTDVTIPTEDHDNGHIKHVTKFRIQEGGSYYVECIKDNSIRYNGWFECSVDEATGTLYIGNPELAGLPNPNDEWCGFFVSGGHDDDTDEDYLTVILDTNSNIVGTDMYITCESEAPSRYFRLENATVTSVGTHLPSEGYDAFASVTVALRESTSPYGLYAVYNDREEQIMDWNGLIDGGYFNVMSGSLSNGGSYLSDIIPASESCTTVLRLPDDGTITTIARNAFQNANGLTTIDFGKNCTIWTIDEYAFSYINGIYYLNIPTSLEIINDNSFYSNTGLQKLTFDDNSNLESIGTSAFKQCTNLKYVDFGNFSKLKWIGFYAFQYCSNLEFVDFGNYSELETLNEYAFAECPKLRGVAFGIGSQLKTIGYGAFKECTALSDITIPDGVTTIDKYALSGTAVSSLVIPDSVTSIDSYAFSGCTKLTRVKLSRGMSVVPGYAFKGCTSLTSIGPAGSGASVEIPNNATEIESYAFWDCTGLTNIIIPNNITFIGEDAFSGCTGLTSIGPAGSGADVELSTSLTYIRRALFSYCTSLAEIEVPSHITSFDESAFAGCTGLVKVRFADGSNFTGFENGTFDGCTGLTSIGPIGSGASVEIPDSITEIVGFKNCTNLTSVRFGENSKLTAICGWGDSAAFEGCTGLTSIGPVGSGASFEIPSSVTSIGTYAFRNCTELTEVTIPSGVTELKSKAFDGCTKLSIVTVLAETPPTCNSNALPISYVTAVRVPAASVDAYKAASGWSSYASKIVAIA